MRISDWSSDVCSSDLIDTVCVHTAGQTPEQDKPMAFSSATTGHGHGRRCRRRVSCRRQCSYLVADVAVRLSHRYRRNAQCDAVGWIIRNARRSEEHTSELQSLMRISYAVFCLK